MIWRGTDKLPNRAGTHPEWAGKYRYTNTNGHAPTTTLAGTNESNVTGQTIFL